MPIAKTTKQTIAECKEAHGNRYNYSKTEYVDSKTKIEIGCSKHGSFFMLPINHIRGQNCPKCRRRSREEIICELIKTHRNKYDYSLLQFKLLTDHVKIKCSTHGVFVQVLQDHIKGYRCPKCRGLYRTKAELIAIMNKLHNNKYCYAEMGDEYKSRDKIKIKCPDHSFFYQTVNNHLRGQNCKLCSIETKKEKKSSSELNDFQVTPYKTADIHITCQ